MCTVTKFKLYLYGIEIKSISVLARCNSVFKLYLYGIEILSCTQKRTLNKQFKLYLYGIEICVLSMTCPVDLVQIVPLWN